MPSIETATVLLALFAGFLPIGRGCHGAGALSTASTLASVIPQWRREIRNLKLEIRNNIKRGNGKCLKPCAQAFGPLDITAFGFVSDFELRISDFPPRLRDYLPQA